LSDPQRLREYIDQLVSKGQVDAADLDPDDPLAFLQADAPSLTDAAYRFCLYEPGTHVILSGTGSRDHLRENIKSFERSMLSPANLRFAAPVERRVAIVTGGARGIGRAAALRIAEEGRDIVIADMLDKEGAETVKDIEALGQRALFIKTDVSDEAAVHSMVNKTFETFGRLDILVCCAGILGKEVPFHEQTAEMFDRVMKINVYGVYYSHQAAIPHMLKGGWGRCVTITSAARFGATHVVPYGTSKGAIWSFIAALGNAYPKEGVFVNGVEPGRALTEMVEPRFTPEFLANPGTPVGRYSDAEEVAEVIEFLTSERNTYTTGSVWSVKGGTG
jgi:NAD(P)-dependent dehydrogenase (short-subunit alcohol dehydrogenase family)